MDAFSMLDRDTKGRLTAHELIDSLQQFGVYVHRDDLNLFFRRYDRNSDGRLLYSEFSDAFLPKSSYHSKTLSSRSAYFIHRNIPKFDFFNRDTRD